MKYLPKALKVIGIIAAILLLFLLIPAITRIIEVNKAYSTCLKPMVELFDEREAVFREIVDYVYTDAATNLSIYRDQNNALYVVNDAADEISYEIPRGLTIALETLIGDYNSPTANLAEIKFKSIITNKTGVLFPVSYHSYPPDVTLCYSDMPRVPCDIPFDGIIDKVYWIDDNWHFVARWPKLP